MSVSNALECKADFLSKRKFRSFSAPALLRHQAFKTHRGQAVSISRGGFFIGELSMSVEIKMECVRMALSMYSTTHVNGMPHFTAKDVVASARTIERYVNGTKRGKETALSDLVQK